MLLALFVYFLHGQQRNSLFETERREISISESKKNLIKNSFSAFACCWTTANAHTQKNHRDSLNIASAHP